MAMRAIGSATISFGLVSVPVNLYSAGESAGSVSFNMLHRACGTRLKQQYICPRDNVVVERDDIAKGYEFAKGQYVLFSPEELKALDEQANNTIEITEFVPLDRVERIYLAKAYYMGPDKGGDRAYRLLAKALAETRRAALGQYAARGKQHLVLVRPLGDVLVLEQLHYAAELRPAAEVPLPDTAVKDAELKLAVQLIEQAAVDDFDPAQYRDTVRERVLEAIQRKVEGQEIVAEAPAAEEGKIIDLMEALKASLATSRRPGARKAAARKEEPPAKAEKAADARSRPAKKAARG
jgi:DNA end-binding protein Ku